MDWNTALPDWEARMLSGQSLVPDLPLFPKGRDLALRNFGRLKLPDVIGTPRMTDAAGDWFRDIVAVIFGSYDAEINRRMVQEYFLLVPKKNGKSSYAAAIMVVALIVNRRPNAEFLLIAPTKMIADIAFKQASGIIKLDQALSKLFLLQQHIRTITHRNSGASLQIKAADTDAITGSKSTGILVDETHEFAKKANAAGIFVEIRGALAARPDGFMIQITTQSKEPPQGVFKSELATARKVRDGLLRLPRLAVLYELPVEIARHGGWKDEALWPIVNPNLNRSVDLTFLRNALVTAEDDGPAAMALLASQHFNVEVGTALLNDAWAGAYYWEGAADTSLTLDEILARSDVAVVGGDGGGLDDLLGAAVIGRCKKTRDWLMWNHAWAQTDVFERRKEIVPRLRDFMKAGTLTLCSPDDPTQDVREFADICERVKKSGLMPEKQGVGLDPYSVGGLVDALSARDIVDPQVMGVGQGTRLSPATWGLERKLKDGTLWHAGQDMMAWCVGNAKIEQRGNAVMITKQAAGKAKIDPLVASLNAAMLMSRNPEAKREPQYQMIVL